MDDVTAGGFQRGRLFLLEGSPGTGKTTIATQFLIAGAAAGEKTLYITLSETENELREGAASHGWVLDGGVDIFELVPPESLLDEDQQQSLLYSSDLELGETTKRIFEALDREKPDRVVLDSLSEIRLLAQSSLRYRRQILALKHYFARRSATVLMLDDLTSDDARQDGAQRRARRDPARGTIAELRAGAAPAARRQISRPALPRRLSRFHHRHRRRARVPAARLGRAQDELQDGGASQRSLPELNALLGGGVETRLEHVDPGPGRHRQVASGADLRRQRGQPRRDAPRCSSSTRNSVCCSSAPRGSESICRPWSTPSNLSHRAGRCGRAHAGRIFRTRAASASRTNKARTVVIDSLNGYQAAMPEEQALILHMHELLQYLNRQGASTFLTVAQHGLVGDMKAPVDVTYLADTVILLRYFEAAGRVRRAISVIKKRTSAHEDTIREYPHRQTRHHARRAADRLPGCAARRAVVCRSKARRCSMPNPT